MTLLLLFLFPRGDLSAGGDEGERRRKSKGEKKSDRARRWKEGNEKKELKGNGKGTSGNDKGGKKRKKNR